METEEIKDVNTQEKFEENFVSDKFDEKSFFRLGREVRRYWPHDVTSAEFKIPALTLTEW